MPDFSFENLSIPPKSTLTAGKDAFNQEAFFGMLLDLATIIKTSGYTWSDQGQSGSSQREELLDQLTTLNAKLDSLIEAVKDLSYNGEIIDLGDIQIIRKGKTFSITGV